MSSPEDPAVPPGDASAVARGGLASGIAGAAVVIALVTILSRLAGFGRVFVLGQTAGQTCLATAYVTANQVPNVVFEVVAGGALASVVVPLLSGAVERGDTQYASRIASGLLTWAIVVTVPVTVTGMFLTEPVMDLLVPAQPHGCTAAEVVGAGAPMLMVFLPQIVLYGVAVVLGGVLQAHRRFVPAAVMPLVNSLLVMATYVVFAVLAAGSQDDLDAVPEIAKTVLAVGTTLGVLGLTLTVVVPMWRTGLRLRPTLTFPPGIARKAVALASAGLAALAAQQVSTIVVLRLANNVGGYASFYTYAWSLYLLPYAVLAVPLATSTFQRLSSLADAGDHAGFAATTASTTRAVVLASALGAAALAGIAAPFARVFVSGTAGLADPTVLAAAMVAFAPGVVGYGLIAHLGRVLYARHRGRAAAVATVTGWLTVIVADVAFVAVVPREDIVTALGAGNTVGMTVAGVLLVAATWRGFGRDALAGLWRSLLAAVLGGAVAAVAGGWAGGLGGAPGRGGSLLQTLLAGVVVILVFAGIALLVDRRDAVGLLRKVMRRG